MENVTDRTSNPFGMRPACESPCSERSEAAFGYGDANADFHVIGDYPGIHGGRETGVPFTERPAGEAIQRALFETGFASEPYGDAPELENCFLSYLHMCCPADGEPTAESYANMERFFDAELRAIAAHVLLPVGERAMEYVVDQYTARLGRIELDMAKLHASEVRGSGFLVVPIREPTDWEEGDGQRLIDSLLAIRGSDYRRTADLSRFLGTDELYFVR
ncbi:uracil-DNA glycosylase family protein [Halalkalicoccus subterraneus]|uniref:uracil-DNA glycosylase family protein n=1 Tax=Halalkalicoccus subterraneus TaxID=2675002 RepID=UPI000EFD1A00|nr:uracil-DNA glycosylase family protein [Halalkalicoccus subterraneus]